MARLGALIVPGYCILLMLEGSLHSWHDRGRPSVGLQLQDQSANQLTGLQTKKRFSYQMLSYQQGLDCKERLRPEIKSNKISRRRWWPMVATLLVDMFSEKIFEKSEKNLRNVATSKISRRRWWPMVATSKDVLNNTTHFNLHSIYSVCINWLWA